MNINDINKNANDFTRIRGERVEEFVLRIIALSRLQVKK